MATEIVLYDLNIHKSIRPESIHTRVLRVNVLAGPFSSIYQKSQESGEVLAHFKLASITLSYQIDMRESPGNYRHVSLNLALGKVLER